MATFKLGLALAIGFLAMPTDAARPAGVARVNRHYHDSGQCRLVGQERTQLIERPARMPISLGLLNRDPVADAIEILDGDRTPGCLSFSDDLLADAMVLIAAVVRLPLANLGEPPSGTLGADTVQARPRLA